MLKSVDLLVSRNGYIIHRSCYTFVVKVEIVWFAFIFYVDYSV